jgi:hypothetical protein
MLTADRNMPKLPDLNATLPNVSSQPPVTNPVNP